MRHKSIIAMDAELARNLQLQEWGQSSTITIQPATFRRARAAGRIPDFYFDHAHHFFDLAMEEDGTLTRTNEEGDLLILTARDNGEINIRILRTADSPTSSPVKLNLDKNKYDKMIKDVEFNGKSDDSCVICQEDFKKEDRLKITPCSHIFHPQCISKWLETECIRPTCPTCRHDCREDFSKAA